MPDVFEGHIDQALSQFAQRYTNRELIADLVAPRVQVDRQADKYWVWGREGMQGAGVDDERAPGAPAVEVGMSKSTTPYFCPDHARKAVYPLEEVQNDNAGDVRQDYIGTITDQILLGHEARVAALLTTAANFPAGSKVQLSGNDQWNSGDAAADAIEDIETGKEAVALKTGVEANTLVLGRAVYAALKQDSAILDRLKYTKVGKVTAQDLAEIFEVDRVLVGRAISRSAAGVNSNLWGKHAVLMYVQPTPSRMDISAAKTFVWRNAPGTSGGFQSAFYPHPEEDRKAEVAHVHFYHDEKITAAESMYLIEDAVA